MCINWNVVAHSHFINYTVDCIIQLYLVVGKPDDVIEGLGVQEPPKYANG